MNDTISFESYDSILLPLPQSSLYELRSSATSGRGIIAKEDLSSGTPILQTSSSGLPCTDSQNGGVERPTDQSFEALSPAAHVILRPYRKEVCGECFAYDRGRDWKIKLSPENGGGMVFCSDGCRTTWVGRYDVAAVAAFTELETALRKQSKRTANISEQTQRNIDADEGSNEVDHPSLEDIRRAWSTARETGDRILEARLSSSDLSKAQRKILRQAAEPTDVVEDISYYLLTGVLSAYNSAKFKRLLSQGDRTGTDEQVKLPGDNEGAVQSEAMLHDLRALPMADLLPSLLTLTPDPQCYAHPASSLGAYTASYQLLLSLMPAVLLPFLTPELAHELNSRASHNAFSIRPSGDTDGQQSGEFMGWGVWPAASFFNHSCASNLSKIRLGRQWCFAVDGQLAAKSQAEQNTNVSMRTDRVISDVQRPHQVQSKYNVLQGEELCITYLGGDERDLNLQQRQKRLSEVWGFLCQCQKCIMETTALSL